jgi:predicted peptidase
MAQHAYVFHASKITLNYLLFLPRAYLCDAQKRWPLILFLHGAGERGDDIEKVKTHGIPQLVEDREDFPFMAISPQCPPNSWWYVHLTALRALLDHVTDNHRVDEDRIYLTGISMGGYGTWHLASRYPERFAAIAPICGGALASRGFPEKARALREVPIWAFHGANDTVVPLEESSRLVRLLEAIGGNVQFTVYPDAGHDSWTRTYQNPELYQWFLAHDLSQRRNPMLNNHLKAEP